MDEKHHIIILSKIIFSFVPSFYCDCIILVIYIIFQMGDGGGEEEKKRRKKYRKTKKIRVPFSQSSKQFKVAFTRRGLELNFVMKIDNLKSMTSEI